ncbi:universal stress protein [Halorientalis halophila]|uniref:universal stress protein n=1 Tax=Halorientalis halophila TaxID=3108499 RepID=UPI003009B662
MYDSILVPTDGSDAARAAVDHAIDHAERYDATLHVLYVIEAPPTDEATTGDVLDSLEATGKRAIQEVTDQARAADVGTVEGMVAEGQPHRAILTYVEDNGIDLVVMGTHGRTGLDRYLLGSVTEKVVRTSPVPVLTVRSEESD